MGKRKIAENLVEKITVGTDEIDITWSCRPSSEELCKSQRQLIPLIQVFLAEHAQFGPFGRFSRKKAENSGDLGAERLDLTRLQTIKCTVSNYFRLSDGEAGKIANG